MSNMTPREAVVMNGDQRFTRRWNTLPVSKIYTYVQRDEGWVVIDPLGDVLARGDRFDDSKENLRELDADFNSHGVIPDDCKIVGPEIRAAAIIASLEGLTNKGYSENLAALAKLTQIVKAEKRRAELISEGRRNETEPLPFESEFSLVASASLGGDNNMNVVMNTLSLVGLYSQVSYRDDGVGGKNASPHTVYLTFDADDEGNIMLNEADEMPINDLAVHLLEGLGVEVSKDFISADLMEYRKANRTSWIQIECQEIPGDEASDTYCVSVMNNFGTYYQKWNDNEVVTFAINSDFTVEFSEEPPEGVSDALLKEGYLLKQNWMTAPENEQSASSKASIDQSSMS